MKERFYKIIEQYGIDINSDVVLEDMESIEFISMIIELEEEFNITIPDDFLNVLTFNVKSLYFYINDIIDRSEERRVGKECL